MMKTTPEDNEGYLQPDHHYQFSLDQIHIEVARNATDDFNLFHDKHKWQQVQDNPFQGPIVMGYQLNCLIEYRMKLYRELHGEHGLIKQHGLRFSNYQMVFINAVRPKVPVQLDIKKTLITHAPDFTLSNRITMKSNDKAVLLGFKKESTVPLFLADTTFTDLPDLHSFSDCSRVANSDYFLKRKYMNNGCVKNFLSGSLAEQADYFDELLHIAHYPETFPCSLVSGALMEKAHLENYDFKRNPMVYTSHQMSIDRYCLNQLKNNSKLHILIRQYPESSANTLNKTNIRLRTYDCYGLLESNAVLFRLTANLVPLKEILKTVSI
jgi:hypothetical protein